MFEMIFVRHYQMTNDLLNSIIKVKSVAWPYSRAKQINWIASNLKDLDIHVLLFQNQKPIAYLNLIEIEISVNKYFSNAYGIGNVCAIEKGIGWGGKLILQTNIFIKNHNKIGLLFCKSQLVKFYSDNDWELVSNEKLIIPFKNNVFTMVFNSPEELSKLEYIGKAF